MAVIEQEERRKEHWLKCSSEVGNKSLGREGGRWHGRVARTIQVGQTDGKKSDWAPSLRNIGISHCCCHQGTTAQQLVLWTQQGQLERVLHIPEINCCIKKTNKQKTVKYSCWTKYQPEGFLPAHFQETCIAVGMYRAPIIQRFMLFLYLPSSPNHRILLTKA